MFKVGTTNINLEKTYLAKLIDTCGVYEGTAVRIDPLSESWPDPPKCQNCGGLDPQFVRRCTECKQVFFRWFRFTLSNSYSYADPCWDCLVAWYRENVSSHLRMTPEMGFQSPPESVRQRPRDMSDIESDLDDLFSRL